NHAEHFLTRVDRLNTPQAELALSLYRDDALVRYVLGQARLPDSAERVAISLAQGDEGPYVIVTREGKFVTCLGKGMRLHDDQSLIAHHTLQHLGSKIDALRQLIEDSARGERPRCNQLLKRVLDAGYDV